MLWHRDRRETQQWAKSGPPLRGRTQKSADLRHLLARSRHYATAPHSSSALF